MKKFIKKQTNNKFKTRLLIDVRHVELRLRYFLVLFAELLSNSAATIDGTIRSSEEVAAIRAEELPGCSVELGIGGRHRHLLVINFEVSIFAGVFSFLSPTIVV